MPKEEKNKKYIPIYIAIPLNSPKNPFQIGAFKFVLLSSSLRLAVPSTGSDPFPLFSQRQVLKCPKKL